jgi:hypothetical protein
LHLLQRDALRCAGRDERRKRAGVERGGSGLRKSWAAEQEGKRDGCVSHSLPFVLLARMSTSWRAYRISVGRVLATRPRPLWDRRQNACTGCSPEVNSADLASNRLAPPLGATGPRQRPTSATKTRRNRRCNDEPEGCPRSTVGPSSFPAPPVAAGVPRRPGVDLLPLAFAAAQASSHVGHRNPSTPPCPRVKQALGLHGHFIEPSCLP